MAKRLVRKFSDVVTEVISQLKSHYNVTDAQIKAWKARAKALPHTFPTSSMLAINDLWIDYEVQRDVIYAHVINIMKKWDPRICSPGSACRTNINGILSDIHLYDAQHRALAAAILGYTEIPCALVITNDSNFASYAFELLNDTGVKRLNPSDLHRNALVRFKNGSLDIKNVRANTMQTQFDLCKIDLQDKGSRNSPTLRGDNDYFFSHFKYAQKAIELDNDGIILHRILSAIKKTFPKQEEIDQGVFIGLLELHRLTGTNNITLPDGWMSILLKSLKKTFTSSATIHSKSKAQWAHSHPGATWSAPAAMANFMRELHIHNGGKLRLPYHGEGAKVGVVDGNFAPGLFPTIPHEAQICSTETMSVIY